jgi:hypothetical protein
VPRVAGATGIPWCKAAAAGIGIYLLLSTITSATLTALSRQVSMGAELGLRSVKGSASDHTFEPPLVDRIEILRTIQNVNRTRPLKAVEFLPPVKTNAIALADKLAPAVIYGACAVLGPAGLVAEAISAASLGEVLRQLGRSAVSLETADDCGSPDKNGDNHLTNS